MSHWQSVEGKIVEGHRIASGLAKNNPFGDSTIRLQFPLFNKQGLDLSNCYMGTLNVSVVPRIFEWVTKEPHYQGLKWHPDHQAEDFFVCACQVIFNGATYNGWVYHPDPRKKIGHLHDPSTLEIIAPHIPGIVYGDTVKLFVDRRELLIK